MGFGVNHTLERIAVEALFDGSSQRLHVAPGVVAADDGVPNAVQEAGAPLRAEACPPAPVGLVIHSLSCMSSAIVIFHGCRLRTSLFIHCSRLQPSGISEPGSWLRPQTLRIQPVASNRRPSQ